MSTEEAGKNQAYCRPCGFLFASVDAFDQHRDNGKCLHPSVARLTLRQGAWCTPADVERRDKMAKARAARGKP